MMNGNDRMPDMSKKKTKSCHYYQKRETNDKKKTEFTKMSRTTKIKVPT